MKVFSTFYIIKQLQFTGSNTQTQTQSFALRQTNNTNYDIEISTGDTVNG